MVVVLVHGAVDELCGEGNDGAVCQHGDHTDDLDDV